MALAALDAWENGEIRLSRSLWDTLQREALGDAESTVRPGAGVLFCGITRSSRGRPSASSTRPTLRSTVKCGNSPVS